MSKTKSNQQTIRILVADDHPIIRSGLIGIINIHEDFEVIGEVSSGKEVIEFVKNNEPDILLLDIEMPELDGVEVIKILSGLNSQVKIIVFTAFNSDERIVTAIKAGAKGYIMKGASSEEIIGALRTVYAGETALQPSILSKLFNQIKQDFKELTPRELDVLQQLSKGLTNKSIANKLFISERTVKFHISSIFKKLDVATRTEAVSIAVQKGLIDL